MLNNKNIVVLGGFGKIGYATAQEILNNNGKVLIVDKINKSRKKEFISKNSNLEILNLDILENNSMDKIIKFAKRKFKTIDGFINAFYPKSKKWGTNFEKLNIKYLKEDISNQLAIPIIISQRIILFYLKQGFGNLINISSIQGSNNPKFEHYKNLNMTSPIEYSAIKSATISYSKYLAKLYKKKNIRINIVSPGGIEDNQNIKFKKRYIADCNSKGLLEGKDIANTIIFLLSDKSKYINGQNIIVDDGWSL